MKWERSKRFCISLAALSFLFSALSWAEVCYTDEEAAELGNILTTLEGIVTTQGRQLETQKTLLTQAQTSIFNSKQEILLLNDSLREAEKSWRRERIALIIQAGSVGIGIGIGITVAVYFIFK